MNTMNHQLAPHLDRLTLNIALFGTSADPPTQGHQKILTWLVEHYDHVAVWASDNPFKHHGASLEQRTEMLQLVADAVQQTQEGFDPRFGQRLEPKLGQHCSPRIDVYPEMSSPRSLISLQRAQHRWPNASFTLVIGSDLVRQIPQWYAAEALLAQVKLLIIPRPGYPLLPSELGWLRDRTTVAIAPIQGPAVSSTDYRQDHTPVINAAVQAYIQGEQLYPCPDALLETPQ